MTAEIIEATKEEVRVDAQKRAFMKKFGKYAAVGAGMAVLMTPTESSANCYGGHSAGGGKKKWSHKKWKQVKWSHKKWNHLKKWKHY